MSDVKLGSLVRIKTSPLVDDPDDPIGIVIGQEVDRVRVLHNQPSLLVNPCDVNRSAVELVNNASIEYDCRQNAQDK